MVDCYWISQLYHKSVRSCFIFWKKESRVYAGSGVLQTPTAINGERKIKNG
ncbi:olfactory receptor 4F15 [[Clostridium] clostridioforme]|nr:olfactory receptor 4F15 [Enterocloster clostridioformis]